MDILYYSNYCKHSQKLLQYLVKNSLTGKLNCINIDKRKRNPFTNQMQIFLENGSTVMLPLNVHSVPSLLLIQDKYKVIVGDEIYKYFTPKVAAQTAVATNHQGEPAAYVLGSAPAIVSEQYTFYDMSPEELSAKGKGGMRQMYNYVAAMHDGFTIPTPPDTYRPDKINEDSLEKLQQKRNEELGFLANMPSIGGDMGGGGGMGGGMGGGIGGGGGMGGGMGIGMGNGVGGGSGMYSAPPPPPPAQTLPMYGNHNPPTHPKQPNQPMVYSPSLPPMAPTMNSAPQWSM